MSKIYEALQHAHKQKKGKENVRGIPVPFESRKHADTELGEEMLSLYKIIETLLPHTKSKIIQFIGSREGEGASTIAREFARVSADLIGNSVLLLDADRHHPSQSHYFDVQSEYGWIDALKKGDQMGSAFYRIGQSSLFMSPSCNSSVSTPEIFKSPTFDGLCQALRIDFDLVLIDSAPLTASPDGLAIASKVDGVILVVEAEKTRWQTVKQVRESITRVGGNILGVVLNKRRYYIPQSIYKYL
jgi:protein-tyrosine kinase